uniref:COMM domain-containing protein n=1 Tax=Globisporangium ultimum (strain ATCC 200006 / CBS 805.95 / DAOM BR144) TaxID=431595 RepID=K3WSH6_GLOUD
MTWDERVLDAVARAKAISIEQFDAVCNMAVLLFHADKRQSKKRLSRTASACGWDDSIAEDTVLAFAKILMDSAMADLSEYHFQVSMKAMDLPAAHAEELTKLYLDNLDAIKESVCRETGTTLPRYRSLDWRIDLEVGSRFMRNKPKPFVTLRLDTMKQKADDLPQRQLSCVRVDYENLRNLQRQLEAALHEVDATHASRIQRYLH